MIKVFTEVGKMNVNANFHTLTRGVNEFMQENPGSTIVSVVQSSSGEMRAGFETQLTIVVNYQPKGEGNKQD